MGRTSCQYYTSSRTKAVASALLVVFALSAGSGQAKTVVDRVAARVKSDVILLSEINAAIDMGATVVSEFPSLESDTKFNKARNDLINLALVKQRAEELSISVEPEKVRKHIERVAESNQMTVSQLEKALEQQGRTVEEYESNVHNQLLFLQVTRRDIIPKVKYTDQDILRFYLEQVGSRPDVVEIGLYQILIKPGPESQGQIAAALEFLNKNSVKDPEPRFIAAVSKFSDQEVGETVDAIQMRLSDLPDVLRGEVDKLQPGQFSRPVESAAGHQIIFLKSRTLVSNAEFEANKISYEETLRKRLIVQQTERWLADARRSAEVRLFSHLDN